MSFADQIKQEQEAQEALESEWQLGDYIGSACPNCERHRLCKCPNGKHRCDKCNWVREDNKYCCLAL